MVACEKHSLFSCLDAELEEDEMMRRLGKLMVKILLGGAIIFTGATLGTIFATRWCCLAPPGPPIVLSNNCLQVFSF